MRYQIKHATVKYDDTTILQDVNFEIRDSEKIAVVGRNGCGKTTLLKLMTGDVEMANPTSDLDTGIFMSGKQEIGYLKQISFEDGSIPVEEEIKKVFAPIFETEKRMREIEEQLKDHDRQLMGEYDFLQKKMEALNGYTWKQDMEIMFQKFGFDLEDLKRPIGTFSGGQQTKVAFIKLLLSRPDIMLLDEPTNHLDLPTIEWLEGYLKSYDKAVVIVSHDRMFLDNVADVTYEIEYHRIKRYPGNYTAFMKQKELDFKKQEKDYEEQQKEIARLTEWIEKWKNTPSKVAATRSKRMVIEHMVKIEKPQRFDTKTFKALFTPNFESYSDVLDVKKLVIGYDEPLAEVTFHLGKRERLAVIGENGKGKSTLLKTLVGEIPPLDGTARFGANVQFGYYDQQKAVVNDGDPYESILDNFWNAYPNLLREDVRSALGAFQFSGEDVEKAMGQLSGGEKVRLELCKMFYAKPNLLILDEPTNHMDIMGKEALENMLKEYTGTVLFVSHDRYFIRQIATGVLEFNKDEVRQYKGTYEEYLEEKDKREKGLITDLFSEKKKPKAPEPTLDDVFDKKTYYNPGKIRSRLETQLGTLERKLAESEEKADDLKMQLADPDIASDYERLMELQEKLAFEEHQQETLLERMLEAETELHELEEQMAKKPS
ncbi:MAG: ABC-F family ATP-binding cassette domain-containing protein [Lachnospiraceae bacterium]|nr:ABC-F family ATP-binding cassette domain-containing protein [Lachnospiraceae bacterium]